MNRKIRKKTTILLFVQMYSDYTYNVNYIHLLYINDTVSDFPHLICLIRTSLVFSVIFLHILTNIVTGFLFNLLICFKLLYVFADFQFFVHYIERQLK